VKRTNILASVVALCATAGNGWDWNLRNGRWDDGGVGAVLENDAIAATIVGFI
jgi:hypothetical protein